MKRFSATIIALVLLVIPSVVTAQQMPVSDSASKNYAFVSLVFNRIQNSTGLDSFYKKLHQLKSGKSGHVSIVHIGDSHIQADFLSDVVRDGMQDFFGNAGRGLVFPHQLAQSNAPDDISSYSNVKWQFNRLAHPEIPYPSGISGFGINTTTSEASLTLSLKNGQSFNRLKFFTDNSPLGTWIVQADKDQVADTLNKGEQDSLGYQQLELYDDATAFTISSSPSLHSKEFYGVSLEKSAPGVLYHTIGVNGARYDQYNGADLFWKQLPALKADLYIISLGTNEAQRAVFAEAAFLTEITKLLQKLKTASPGASVLITTAPDSYKGRRFNAVLKQLNASLTAYCNQNFIPLWDLYRITNGYGSAYSWSRRGLMSRDRVHFTAAGYRLQGSLLLGALGKGYNAYLSMQ